MKTKNTATITQTARPRASSLDAEMCFLEPGDPTPDACVIATTRIGEEESAVDLLLLSRLNVYIHMIEARCGRSDQTASRMTPTFRKTRGGNVSQSATACFVCEREQCASQTIHLNRMPPLISRICPSALFHRARAGATAESGVGVLSGERRRVCARLDSGTMTVGSKHYLDRENQRCVTVCFPEL